jgi:hypothetical protein
VPETRFTTSPDPPPHVTCARCHWPFIYLETSFIGIGQLGTDRWDNFARRTCVEVVNRLILALLALVLRGLNTRPVRETHRRFRGTQ